NGGVRTHHRSHRCRRGRHASRRRPVGKYLFLKRQFFPRGNLTTTPNAQREPRPRRDSLLHAPAQPPPTRPLEPNLSGRDRHCARAPPIARSPGERPRGSPPQAAGGGGRRAICLLAAWGVPQGTPPFGHTIAVGRGGGSAGV